MSEDTLLSSYEDEKIIWEGSPSLIIFLGQLLFSDLIVIGLIILYLISPPPVNIICLILISLPLLFFAWKVILTKSIKYKITDQRFICTTGIFSKKTESIELYRVRDIEVFEPFFYRLFRKGIIRLITADTSTPSFNVKAVPEPKKLYDKLRIAVERRRDLKRVRGIEFEQYDETS